MRISNAIYLLAGLSNGAVIANPGSGPRGEGLDNPTSTASPSSLVAESATTLSPVSLRKINWKIVRGGLKVSRDVIVVAGGATVAIGTILGWVQADSHKNSCAAIGGSGESDNGKQKYHFRYWVTTTGKNCDTTAQTKTVAAALYDAWDEISRHRYEWACIDLTHGGTWHGHLAVATVSSGMNVNTMCNP